MIAIEIREPGEPDVLVPVERPMPVPAPDEVLIRVAAAGVNRPDILQRRGHYPPPPGASDIPGLEVSGVDRVARPRRHRLARRRRGLRAGLRRRLRRVLRRAGAAVPAGAARHGPRRRAAAIPETFFTVWTNVFERGRLQPNESLLVHGGSSGIGTTAIQLATREGRARVRDRGIGGEVRAPASGSAPSARSTIATTDFVAVVRELTGGRGVDVVLDMVGGDYFARNIEVLAVDGRLVEIATLHGVKAELNIQTDHAAAADDHRLDAAAAAGRGEGARSPPSCSSRSGRCSSRARSSRSSTRRSRCARPPRRTA